MPLFMGIKLMIRINTISYCSFDSIYRSDGTLGMERVIVRHIILIIIIVIMFLLLIFNAKYNDTKLLYHHDSDTFEHFIECRKFNTRSHVLWERDNQKMSSDISGPEEPDVWAKLRLQTHKAAFANLTR